MCDTYQTNETCGGIRVMFSVVCSIPSCPRCRSPASQTAAPQSRSSTLPPSAPSPQPALPPPDQTLEVAHTVSSLKPLPQDKMVNIRNYPLAVGILFPSNETKSTI